MEPLNVPEANLTALIRCCMCGLEMAPNPSNMCAGCLRQQVNLTEGVGEQATLSFCRGCDRYLQPPSDWVSCALESRELLSVCLKRLKGLNRLKLIDAGFVWTEPHSKRLKVKLTVQGDVMGAILQKEFVVVYTIQHQMCDQCHRAEAKDFWKALVQVRQKAENKKTFYYLEQLILKHKAHENTLGIKPIHGGLDFYYATESHAKKMVDFLAGALPCRCHHSKKLISHDIHSNVYNYKFTYAVEIVPIGKDSVVCLPRGLRMRTLAAISPLCVVYRVTNAVHLIDPSRGQIAELSSAQFWRSPFQAICDPAQLVEYTVMDVEPIRDREGTRTFPGQGAVSSRHVVADVWLVKSTDLGKSDRMVHTRTHLGHVLKPGDAVLGYNLGDSNVNDAHFDELERAQVPDVVVVKKHYADRSSRKRRAWKLKRLAAEGASVDGRDFNEFLDDLEEDPELRRHVNIFKDKSTHVPVDEYDADYDSNRPRITLEEMLDDLDIQDVEMTE